MNILFVCRGNVFRSLSAEYCLKKYLESVNIKEIGVFSAGIEAIQQPVPRFILNQLSKLEIDASGHKQTKLEKEHLIEADLIVSMGINHKKYIERNFNYPSYLFNEICYEKITSVLDIHDAVPGWESRVKESRNHMKWTINYIHSSMPYFLENYKNFVFKLRNSTRL